MSEPVVIGNATLYHGDCLEILPTLKADLIVTSPPYNIKKKYWGDRHRAGMHAALQAKFVDEWYDDELPEADYQAWQKSVVAACLTAAPVVCYNHKIRYAIKRENRVIHPMEFLGAFPLWSEVVWDRGGGPAQNCRRPVPADERIYVLSSRPPVWNDCGYTSVWKVHAAPQGFDHPCPFPVEIPLRCISQFSNADQTVIDPFMGVASTGAACANLGRKFIGIEIERKYFDIACERIDQAQRQGRMFA